MAKKPTARTKPYYSKKQLSDLIKKGKVSFRQRAIEGAKKSFGWKKDHIKKAIIKLPQQNCYKSEPRFNNPKIWVDYYRAPDIFGEHVYTHFYVENGILIIDSFKEK